MLKNLKSLDKNVWLLGILSFSADLASQMVYPLLPQFMLELGANGRIIGLIEGIAEAAASLLRAVFGKLSDKWQNRKGFIWMGYGLAALAKPILFIATSAYHILGIRFMDRLGKAFEVRPEMPSYH
ncbi:MAG: MFS transporter [Bacteroidia bacterium]